MLTRITGLLLLALALTGCGSVHFNNVKMAGENPVATRLTPEQENSVQNLQFALKGLGPHTSQQEATMIAYEAVVYSMVLANKYGLTYPPLWHNVMVNAKKRPRGLCYHWQRDLMAHFKKKNLKTFDLKEGVAYEKDYWREHNTLVVTAKGQSFNTGIVLDPWRNSGTLTWARVTEDKYPWKLRIWKDQKNRQFTNSGAAVNTTTGSNL